MAYYVYILANKEDDELYKGFTENPDLRLRQHNNQESSFTSTKMQWCFVCVIQFATKGEALIFEKRIKRWKRSSLQNLIGSEKNIAKLFS